MRKVRQYLHHDMSIRASSQSLRNQICWDWDKIAIFAGFLWAWGQIDKMEELSSSPRGK